MKTEKKATLGMSIVMFFVCVAILSVCIIAFKQDVQIPLCLCCGALMIYGVAYLKIKFTDLMGSMVESVKSAVEVMLIILVIGGVVGTWVGSGVVPVVIVYGLKIFSAKFFLPTILVICSIMSVITGSSWTTMGTVGIAFMGVGVGLGFNPAVTAGVIVCGAYFGDKQSPMSDTTNYAAAVAGTDLYKHVKSMMYTTGPAIVVALIISLIMSLGHEGGDAAVVNEIIDGLQGAFHLSWALLIPLLLMIVLIVLKVPALPCITICALVGVVFGMIFQGYTLPQGLSQMMSGFTGNTGNAVIDKLLTRGGFSSMYSTIGIMLWSLSMAGLFMRCGIISSVMERLVNVTKTRFGLIVTQLLSGYVLSFIAADPYLAMVIPAKAFGEKYDELGIDRSVTSRTCEDGGTIVCPMVPWGSNGVYTAATLGVATLSYLPYYFLGYINPIFSILCAATGWGVKKADPERLEELRKENEALENK